MSTLGELIATLEASDPGAVAKVGISNPHSWRGDYEELAFEPAPSMTAAEMLAVARSALGRSFDGYKGGEFEMSEWTDVHLSLYGSSMDYFPLVALAPDAALIRIRADNPWWSDGSIR